jgi:manganese efflux pump family protein
VSFAAVLTLALGLAMDATAVAAARGLAAPVVHVRHALAVGTLFGGAQALMPLLGYLLGDRLGPLIARWDHWVAFVLLAGIGAKMLWEARSAGEEVRPDTAPFAPRVLLILALATSIDAFAAGITLPMIGAPLALSLATIGITTAVLSGAAVFVGRHFGNKLGRKLDVAGGVVLIGLGVKILVEHLRG